MATITQVDIRSLDLTELKTLVDMCSTNTVSIDKTALQELFNLLSKPPRTCKGCDVTLLNQEFVGCNDCDKADSCVKCIVTCGNNSTHKVHYQCLVNCELCDEKVCSKCYELKKIPSMHTGFMYGNNTPFHFDTKVCVKCVSKGRTTKVYKCTKCNIELLNNKSKCDKCTKLFCNSCCALHFKFGNHNVYVFCYTCGEIEGYTSLRSLPGSDIVFQKN